MSEELKEKEFNAGRTGVYRFQQDAWDGWVLHDCTVPPQPIRHYVIGAADEEIRELTESNFVYGDQIQLSTNPFPFPSIGHVRTTDHQSYEFVPERWVWR